MAIDELAPAPGEERLDDLDVTPPGADGSLVVLGEVWQDQEAGGLWKVIFIQRKGSHERLERVGARHVGGGGQAAYFSPEDWHRRFLWAGKDVESARNLLGLSISH